GRTPGSTTDGTSFSIGANGQLARVAPNGGFTTSSGFPTDVRESSEYVQLSWNGTTGWYVVSYAQAVGPATAQRFDAAGAPDGIPIGLDIAALLGTCLVDGNDLLAVVQIAPNRIGMMRVAPTGAIGAAVPLGAGIGSTRVDRGGTEVIVAWSRSEAIQVVGVAP